MENFIKYLFRFVVLMFVQVFVLDKVPPLHQFIKPSLYFIFILWFPFNMSRAGLLICGFVLGITLDYLLGTPGLHASACTTIAFIRPFLLDMIVRNEESDHNFTEPSFISMGWGPYFIYAFLMTFVHNACVVFIEWMHVGSLSFFVGKVAGMTIVSLLMIFIVEIIFERKKQNRPA